MLSFRFRTLYQNMGLTRPMAAKLLHVSERTLHNWESGHHEIPYAAYKLLRILSRHELPGKAWAGWVFHSSRLWSPEGHAFTPQDSSWWSLLIRKSKTWHTLYAENVQLRKDLAEARACFSSHEADGARAGPEGERFQVTPLFSLKTEITSEKTQQPRGFALHCQNINFRFLKIKTANLTPKGGQK